MGRKAGVTSEETRIELLAAAAKVFARDGYEGASIADITREAGLSSGSVYSHFPSKAELFAAAVSAHGQDELSTLLGQPGTNNIADVVELIGSTYDRRRPQEVSLLVEAIVAAKRDPKASKVMRSWFTDNEEAFSTMIRDGQKSGVLMDDIGADSIARLMTMIALGSLLTGALKLPRTDHDEWVALINLLVNAVRAEGSGPATSGRAKARARL